MTIQTIKSTFNTSTGVTQTPQKTMLGAAFQGLNKNHGVVGGNVTSKRVDANAAGASALATENKGAVNSFVDDTKKQLGNVERDYREMENQALAGMDVAGYNPGEVHANAINPMDQGAFAVQLFTEAAVSAAHGMGSSVTAFKTAKTIGTVQNEKKSGSGSALKAEASDAGLEVLKAASAPQDSRADAALSGMFRVGATQTPGFSSRLNWEEFEESGHTLGDIIEGDVRNTKEHRDLSAALTAGEKIGADLDYAVAYGSDVDAALPDEPEPLSFDDVEAQGGFINCIECMSTNTSFAPSVNVIFDQPSGDLDLENQLQAMGSRTSFELSSPPMPGSANGW